MSRDLNKWSGIGNIGKEIDLKQLTNGCVVNNVIACGDDYKDKVSGSKIEKTNWVPLVFFGRNAEILSQYCKKGSKLYVEGKFETRMYEKNGEDRYVSEIKVTHFQMLDSKGNPAGAPQPSSHQQSSPFTDDGFSEDIPFAPLRHLYVY